jgi:hypothetical protein
MLYCFFSNTTQRHGNPIYSTRYVITKYCTILWPIGPATENRPQRLGFDLGSFAIRCGQVTLMQVFIQSLPSCPDSTIPQTFNIHAVLRSAGVFNAWPAGRFEKKNYKR